MEEFQQPQPDLLETPLQTKSLSLKAIISVLVTAVVVGAGIFLLLRGGDVEEPDTMVVLTTTPLLGEEPDSSLVSSFGDRVVIVPHPNGGMYLGQNQYTDGSVNAFENAINKKVALVSTGLVKGSEFENGGALTFDTDTAESLWNNGYVVSVGALEAYPGHGNFTVDKLLRGDYDNDLHDFARQLKSFGKPMIFQTAREPNAVLAEFLGGFGPDGSQPRGWAIQNQKGFREFDPFAIDNPNVDEKMLYKGLGDPEVCDGIERMGAAQRYYYDFFVRREGINYLTFGTMAWATLSNAEQTEIGIPDLYWEGCYKNFGALYRAIGEQYSDWVSINWYLQGAANESRYSQEIDELMASIRTETRKKPVLITELGLCDAEKGTKVSYALNKLMTDYPEVRAIRLWDDSDSFDCQIRSNEGGPEFKQFIQANPSGLNSCVHFSDGSRTLGCESDAPRKLDIMGNGAVIEGSETCLKVCLSTGESQAECSVACGLNDQE